MDYFYCIVLYSFWVFCFTKRDNFLTKRINVCYTGTYSLMNAVFLLFPRNLLNKWPMLLPHVIRIMVIMPVGMFNWMEFIICNIYPQTCFYPFLSPFFDAINFVSIIQCLDLMFIQIFFTPIGMTVYILSIKISVGG